MTNVETTDVTATTCPSCGSFMDAATNASKSGKPRPTPGDFSLCFGCGQALRFDEHLEPLVALDSELAELGDELPRFRRTQSLLRRFVATRKARP